MANDIEVNPGPSGALNGFTICQSNVRSLKTKLLHIKSNLTSNFDIITICETWHKINDPYHLLTEVVIKNHIGKIYLVRIAMAEFLHGCLIQFPVKGERILNITV